MITPYTVLPDLRVFPHYQSAGPFGFLPMNVCLLEGDEPVLVETGLAGTGDELLPALWDEIEPDDLRWIFLSHEDADHSGNLADVLRAAPRARVVMNFLTMLKLDLPEILTPDRVYFVNPGQTFRAGERRFRITKPPLFDSAASIGLFDEESRALYTADALGALIARPARGANDLTEGFDEGFVLFNHVNHGWIGLVDEHKFEQNIDKNLRSLEPEAILAYHAPATVGMTRQMTERLARLPQTERMEMPDDAAFREMLARMKARQEVPIVPMEGPGEAA